MKPGTADFTTGVGLGAVGDAAAQVELLELALDLASDGAWAFTSPHDGGRARICRVARPKRRPARPAVGWIACGWPWGTAARRRPPRSRWWPASDAGDAAGAAPGDRDRDEHGRRQGLISRDCQAIRGIRPDLRQ